MCDIVVRDWLEWKEFVVIWKNLYQNEQEILAFKCDNSGHLATKYLWEVKAMTVLIGE